MENRAHAIAAGVFVLVFTAALWAGASWLGGATIRGVPYDLVTEASVAALSKGTPVKLRGVEVGQVEQLGFDPADSRRVLVRILVDPHIRFPEGTRGTISAQGLAGSSYVELDYPDGALGTLQSSEGEVTTIPLRGSQFAQLTGSTQELMKRFTQTLRLVDGVLTPETTRNAQQLIARLNEAAAGMIALTTELQPAARRLSKVLGDADTLVQSIRPTVVDFDTLIVAANSQGGAIDAIRAGALNTGEAAHDLDRALVSETLPRVNLLVDRLSRATDSLNEVLLQVQNQPQSLIFGLPPPIPGPGEPGFHDGATE